MYFTTQEGSDVTMIKCILSPQMYDILSGFRYWHYSLRIAVDSSNTYEEMNARLHTHIHTYTHTHTHIYIYMFVYIVGL